MRKQTTEKDENALTHKGRLHPSAGLDEQIYYCDSRVIIKPQLEFRGKGLNPLKTVDNHPDFNRSFNAISETLDSGQ